MATIHYVDSDTEGDTAYYTDDRGIDYADRYREKYTAVRASSRLAARALERSSAIEDSRAYRKTLSAFRKVQNRNRSDRVEQLTDMGALQHARAKMRQAIMACPTVAKMAAANRIEGYREEYQPHDSWLPPEQRRAYRIISDGMIDGDNNYVTQFIHDLGDHERITAEDRGDIYHTWANVLEAIEKKKDDPTSSTNACL